MVKAPGRAWALLLAATVAGCTDPTTSSELASLQLTAADERPPGVKLCYSEESAQHPAVLHHLEAWSKRDLTLRTAVIRQLEAASQASPQDERFALLLGLDHLWSVAERDPAQPLDPFALVASAEACERELERAYTLCPTDHRVPGWLVAVKKLLGDLYADSQRLQDADALMERGMHYYPGFVAFNKAIIDGARSPDDPLFANALEGVKTAVEYCLPQGQPRQDPACLDGPNAPHNSEGFALYLGDVYARALDRETALTWYESARAAPGWSRWRYRELVEERIRTLDERIARADSWLSYDDLPSVAQSELACSVCHQD